jgi:hypothetical protein
MSLSNFLKTDSFVKLFNKNPGTFIFAAILIIDMPLTFIILSLLNKLDKTFFIFMQETYRDSGSGILYPSNMLLQHFTLFSLNLLIGIGFIFASITLYTEKNEKNTKSLKIISLLLSIAAIFGYVLMFYQIEFYISLYLYMSIKFAEIGYLLQNYYAAFESKIYMSFLEKAKTNISERGFNSYIYENHHALSSTNIMLTCSEEWYNKIHKILLKYTENEETGRLFVDFILENKICFEGGQFYKIVSNNIKTKITAKEFSTFLIEYIADAKRIQSVKEFLLSEQYLNEH